MAVSNEEHKNLSVDVAVAHERLTGQPATDTEYAVIKAVVRDYLNEADQQK